MTEDVIPDDIRRLLSRHIFEVDPDFIGEDLSCAICSNVMVDAYQTHCGCKYCRGCILTYMDGGNTHCGGRTNECNEEPLVLGRSVFPNNILNKKILRIKVRCPNQPCNFTSKLADMEDHLRVCPQQPIECPYTMIGCGNAGASRDTVETHLHSKTLSHSEMLMAVINNMRNELGGLRESCARDGASLHENARREMRGLVEALTGRLEEEKASRHREKAELVGLIEDQRRTMAALMETVRKMRLNTRAKACEDQINSLMEKLKKADQLRAVFNADLSSVASIYSPVKDNGSKLTREALTFYSTIQRTLALEMAKLENIRKKLNDDNIKVAMCGESNACDDTEINHGNEMDEMDEMDASISRIKDQCVKLLDGLRENKGGNLKAIKKKMDHLDSVERNLCEDSEKKVQSLKPENTDKFSKEHLKLIKTEFGNFVDVLKPPSPPIFKMPVFICGKKKVWDTPDESQDVMKVIKGDVAKSMLEHIKREAEIIRAPLKKEFDHYDQYIKALPKM